MPAAPEAEQLALFRTRVVDVGGGPSAYTFTIFRQPSQPEELFESQHASLVREFANIEREFAATG